MFTFVAAVVIVSIIIVAAVTILGRFSSVRAVLIIVTVGYWALSAFTGADDSSPQDGDDEDPVTAGFKPAFHSNHPIGGRQNAPTRQTSPLGPDRSRRLLLDT